MALPWLPSREGCEEVYDEEEAVEGHTGAAKGRGEGRPDPHRMMEAQHSKSLNYFFERLA